MPLILSLETSTFVCSVAIHKAGKLLAYSEIQIEKSHAEKITLLIEQVAKNSKIELKDLDAIAISKGPGSYTGLRVASSTAKGLCFALDKPLIGIDTLQALALKINIPRYLICPMIDARRLEVYCGLYNDKNQIISEVEAKVIDDTAFLDYLESNKIIFCGDGAEKCIALIVHSNAIFIPDIHPSAKQIGFLAWEKYKNQDFEDIVRFEPHYLKEFYMPVKSTQISK